SPVAGWVGQRRRRRLRLGRPGVADHPDRPRPELRARAVWRYGRHCRRPGHRAIGAPMILDQNVGRIILQLVLWLPAIGAAVVALAGSGEPEPSPDALTHGQPTSMRAWRIATFFAAITFILAAWLLIGFDRSRADQYQFETRIGWLPFGSDYRIAVDGLSTPLLALNALLTLSP